MSQIPECVKVDIHLYFMPTGPESISDGVKLTIGGVGVLPDFSSDKWVTHIAAQMEGLSTLIGPVRPMTNDEIEKYERDQQDPESPGDDEEEF